MTSAEKSASNRYEFGANWASFIDKSYSAERRQVAADKRGLSDMRPAVFNCYDLVAIFDRREAMRNDQHRQFRG